MSRKGCPAEAKTLQDALTLATTYWAAKGPSSRMMPIRAGVGVSELGAHLPLSSLGPEHGTQLLTGLRGRGLSKASLSSYYAAFRRMLALSGVSTVAWPQPGPVPRRVREPFQPGDLSCLGEWLKERGHLATSNLAALLLITGLRVEVEALSPGACSWEDDRVTVTGKGGHQRVVPFPPGLGAGLRSIQQQASRVPYATHLARWNRGVKALGISSRLPTPHAVRHLYATKAYAKCKDLMVVKELLGHADVATTAGYIGVDMERMRDAVS